VVAPYIGQGREGRFEYSCGEIPLYSDRPFTRRRGLWLHHCGHAANFGGWEIVLETNVKSYCRTFPAVFAKAADCFVWDENHRCYLDFLSGCGALNYGHNHPKIKSELIRYIAEDGVTMSMDLATQADPAPTIV